MSTITTTTTSPTTDGGPLPIPRPPDDRTAAAVRRLAGHATSAEWLPIGLDDAVDKLRERQLAQRERTTRTPGHGAGGPFERVAQNRGSGPL